MELSGRRGLKRTYSDRGFLDLPRWEARSSNMCDMDARLVYPHHTLNQEPPSDHYPRFTASLYPSDPSPYYPETSKLVLVNPEPLTYSTPYLPPPSVVASANGLVHVDDYYAPLNPVTHHAPVEVLEPLPAREYAVLPPFREHHRDRLPRAFLPRKTVPKRKRIPSKSGLPPRVSSAPTSSGPFKKTRGIFPEVSIRDVDVKQGKKANKAIKLKAVEEKNKEAKIVKDVKSTKVEEQTVEKSIVGMIFGCNDNTEKECKRMQLFGLPATRKNDVLRVVPGSKLFLFNFDTKELLGVYEAVTQGALDIVPDAFKSHGSFPAQVRTKRILRVPNLPLKKFKPAIKKNFYSGNKFNYELNESQVEKLVKLFTSSMDEVVG